MSPLHQLLVAAGILLLSPAAGAADLPGGKDPEGLKRIEGSEIIHYATSPDEQYFLARGAGAVGAGFEKQERLEGATVRLVYKALLGTSSLDILRFYQQMLAGLGFEETFKLDPGKLNALAGAKDFQQRFYFQADYAARKDHEETPFQDAGNPYYLTARLVREGEIVNVAVYVAESDGLDWQEPGARPIVIRFAQPVIGVDVITSRQADFRPVEVKANDIAKALTDAGTIDIYGIYFDVDRTDLKPESRGTLDEVAKLLKADPALKLEVAGHTDNTGSAAHNLQLSAGRAAAVVSALVTTYGIDRTRLDAKGYGDTRPVAPNDSEQNRAKNRRVELRKL